MDRNDAIALAERLYPALAEWDLDELRSVLSVDFIGLTTATLPLGLGGTFVGRNEMVDSFWKKLGKNYVVRAEPTGYSFDDGSLIIRGRYVGSGRLSGLPLDAAFVHTLTFAGGVISRLEQLTDSAAWVNALGDVGSTSIAASEADVVQYSFTNGLATMTINRPQVRNALNQAAADALLGCARRLVAQSGLRAVLINATGVAFTVGGDISVFAEPAPDELSATLIRMITPYHQALGILDALEVPIVCAVQGAAAGGGLGLIHVADVVLAADDSRFAAGFAGLGLTGDGGSTWFLPRLIGPKRAAEFYLEQRVLTASEAEEWGLITRAVPADTLQTEALAVAQRLAGGPTVAFGRVRRLLRQSWNVPFVSQLGTEGEGISLSASTVDASSAVASFIAKQRPTFSGK